MIAWVGCSRGVTVRVPGSGMMRDIWRMLLLSMSLLLFALLLLVSIGLLLASM